MFWPVLVALAATSSAQEAHHALEVACGRCHAGKDASEGGFDFLFDREALVRERFIVPGKPQASVLVQRLLKREMPPPEERGKGRREALAALERWIRAGAPAEGFDAPKSTRPELLDREQVKRAVLADLPNVSSPQTARWFLVRPGEGPALAKALNSLSWKPRLVHPVPVVDGLVRVDLEDLGWSRDDWEQTLVGAYPFGLEDGTLSLLGGGAQPVLRADWFLANATRPPLYHALARTPANEAGLESVLDVNVKDDVSRKAVVRIGFASSGVSQNNRLIERHATRFGAYWRSYDFASNVGARNLFERPLTFVHDGGEHIFSLPNGLFGYLLTDARGGRIDRGPTTIVRDPRRPDGAVENGLSCMGCHARGLIAKGDQVARAVRASQAGFSAHERRAVELLHPDGAETLFSLDAKRFLAALEALGIDPSEEEPVTRAALAYERDLDLPAAAAELGVSPGALTRALEKGPEAMAPLKLGGAVKRDAFVAAFPALASRLGVGRVRPTVQWRGAVSAAHGCGLEGGTLEGRLEECAVAFPGRARAGSLRLLARDANGREVWFDEQRRLLWSEPQPAASQSGAAARCGSGGLVEGLWFLPTAEQLEAAFADGLPGWQLLWSRDVRSTEKYGVPGVAVSASGRREEKSSQALPSRCVARI